MPLKFGNTYVCESTFYTIKQVKWKTHKSNCRRNTAQ